MDFVFLTVFRLHITQTRPARPAQPTCLPSSTSSISPPSSADPLGSHGAHGPLSSFYSPNTEQWHVSSSVMQLACLVTCMS